MSLVIPRTITSAVSNAEAERLAEYGKGGMVLELGSYLGFSTIVLAQSARMVHAVDWHRGDQHIGGDDTLAEFRENLRWNGLATKVVIHIGRFEDVLPAFRDHYFDLCFIDGAHDEDSVRRDTALALRLVRHSGWIAFHDYGRDPEEYEGFGVDAAVDELAHRTKQIPVVTDSLAVLRR